MVRIRIGNSERELPNASEHWINQQINRQKADGLSLCVRVIINDNSLNLSLSSAGCPRSGSKGRAPRPDEQEIFDLWEKRGLNRANFHGGNLIAFLKQLN